MARLDSLWLGGGKEEAVREIVPAIEAARAARDTFHLTEFLLRRGSFLVFFGRIAPAESSLVEAIALSEAARDTVQICRGLRWLGHTARGRDGAPERKAIRERLLLLARASGDRGHEGWALLKSAYSIQNEGDHEQAIDQFKEALLCFEDAGDTEGEAWAQYGLAISHDNLGDFDTAISVYLETMELSEDPRNRMLGPMALNNIARLEYIMGRYELAMGRFEEARARHMEFGDKRRAVIPSVNVARCLFFLGRTEAALESLEEELVFCVEEGFVDKEQIVRCIIAEFLERSGRRHEAIALCRRALEKEDELSIVDRLEYRIILADALADVGEEEASLRVLEATLAIAEEKGRFIEAIRARKRIGARYLQSGDYEKSLAHTSAVIEESRRLDLSGHLNHALFRAGHCYHVMGELDSAMALMERAAASWEEERKIPLDPEWRESRGDAGREIFTELAAIYLDAPDIDDHSAVAFDRLQAFKARTLLERMLGPGGRPSLLEEGADAPPVTLKTIQGDVLTEGELLLDFYLGWKQSHLFAVTKDEIRVLRLPPSKDLEKKLEGYYELLSSPELIPPGILEEVGGGLSGTFFVGVEDLLRGAERIIVAADGSLNLLPLSDLPVPHSENSEWVRVPSATILARLRGAEGGDETIRAGRLLAVASESGVPDRPLAGAVAEVRALGRKYGDVDQVLSTGADTVRSMPDLADYGVLHIAAHVRADDPSPWTSEILLGPPGDPVNPRASRIAAMDLSAHLAVLSSCNSASGPYVSGEGILGLSSAFISAGVPAVLATLWAVDDGATARFVDRFYDGLAEGRSAARALRDAQLILRADPETSHPFYWAGFVLIGDGDVRIDLERRRSPAVTAAAVVAFLAIAAFLAGRIARNRKTA